MHKLIHKQGTNIVQRIKVAVPGPFFEGLDYLCESHSIRRGARVVVPLGRREVVGIVLGPSAQATDDAFSCKPVSACLDEEGRRLPEDLMLACEWAADYYHHPIGNVFVSALPSLLRKIPKSPARQPRKTKKKPQHAGEPELSDGPVLSDEQSEVLAKLQPSSGAFGVDLLYGVTGSGKTEVYIERCRSVLDGGGQALVLTPEIGLTPQLFERFEARFGSAVSTFHSGMTDRQRADVWTLAASGQAKVLVGTRSSVFLPFARLSLIVVDEEHDASFKQQDGFRYSARDVAIVRAKTLNIPAILGSATPSLESLHNVRAGRYRELKMRTRVAARRETRLKLVDQRKQKASEGLSDLALESMSDHLARGGQILVFINRRGFAPVLLCHQCAWRATCQHCNAHMALHRHAGKLQCHHCGSTAFVPRVCGDCGAAELFPVGQGTERIEEEISKHFPDKRIERIDSDRVRRAGEMGRLLDDIRSGQVDIIVGTQMLSKGHDFQRLSLVCVVDADQALFSIDFRATERLAQLLTQVAGRAGRHELAGEVLVQTHEPDHPILQRWMAGGYQAVADQLIEERVQAGLPPSGFLAMIRADALDAKLPLAFLEQVAREVSLPGVEALGPVPAPMERRANRTRAQLLLQSPNRARLQQFLSELVPKLDKLPGARKLRWSVDVDPVDLF